MYDSVSRYDGLDEPLKFDPISSASTGGGGGGSGGGGGGGSGGGGSGGGGRGGGGSGGGGSGGSGGGGSGGGGSSGSNAGGSSPGGSGSSGAGTTPDAADENERNLADGTAFKRGDDGYGKDYNADSASKTSTSTVTFTTEDGKTYTQFGDHPDRDNNPLDETKGNSAATTIGKDGNIGIFSSADDGWAAAAQQVQNQSDKGATIDSLVNNNSPASDGNNPTSMINYIVSQEQAAGYGDISASTSLSSLSDAQFNVLMNSYATLEGWHGKSYSDGRP